MKKLLSLLVISAGCVAGYIIVTDDREATSHVVETEGLKEVGELNALCVSVSERLTASTSKTRLDYLIVGDAFLGVDFSAIEKTVENGKTVISLPLPKVSHPRVDLSRSRQYDAKRGLFVTDSNLMRARAGLLSKAQELVARQAGHEKFVEEAKAETKRILETLLPGLEFELRWKQSAPISAQP